MTLFRKALSEAEIIAQAVCGTYVMIALSDGQYDASEEVRLVVGILGTNLPAGVAQSDLEAALPAVRKAFEANYAKAADRLLESVALLSGNGVAKRAIMHAARTAVVASRSITPQEEGALERLSEALGLEPGAL